MREVTTKLKNVSAGPSGETIKHLFQAPVGDSLFKVHLPESVLAPLERPESDYVGQGPRVKGLKRRWCRFWEPECPRA